MVRSASANSDKGRDAWRVWCEEHMGGTFDPARHSEVSLKAFMTGWKFPDFSTSAVASNDLDAEEDEEAQKVTLVSS